MSEKQVTIRYPKVYQNRYKVSESSGRFHVYHATGTFFTSLRKLGTSRSLADALELIKADVGASHVEYEIQD